MPKPSRHEIWLVRFPFTDLASTKVRPALVIASYGEDVILLGIFSRMPSSLTPGIHVQIEDQHPAFDQTGLKKTSVIRAEKIAVVHESVFQRKLGILPQDMIIQVQDALKKALLLS